MDDACQEIFESWGPEKQNFALLLGVSYPVSKQNFPHDIGKRRQLLI